MDCLKIIVFRDFFSQSTSFFRKMVSIRGPLADIGIVLMRVLHAIHFFCRATKILTEMRSTFGTSDCSLLCINSSTDAIKHDENPWALFVSFFFC